MDLPETIHQLFATRIERPEPRVNRRIVMKASYEAVFEILKAMYEGFDGGFEEDIEVVHIEADPATRTLKFHLVADYFSTVVEGAEAEEVSFWARSMNDAN